MSPYSKLMILLVTIGIVYILYQLYQLAYDSPHRISSEEARARLAKREVDVVLDVRTEVERKTMGFFPRSIHMPSDRLVKDLPHAFPDKSARILVYCNTGQRARMATDILHAMGYTNSVYITGSHVSLMQ